MSRRLQRLVLALAMLSLFGTAACQRGQEGGTEEGATTDTMMQGGPTGADTAAAGDTAAGT